VSERFLALAHYNIHTREGAPDYQVTETSRISDYLDTGHEPHEAPTFTACGDEWSLVPLTGAMAEALETLAFGSDLKPREHWVIGGMAAQLMRAHDEAPDPAADSSAYEDWLRRRMLVVRGLPSSDIDELYARYRQNLVAGTQYFALWFDEEGVIVLPKKEVAALVPAARFRVDSAVGALALDLAGKLE
jgi:hypothetical protein